MHAWGFGNASHSLVWKTTWPRLRRKRLYSTATLWVSYPCWKERETKPTRTQNHSLLFHFVVSTHNSLVMLSIYYFLTEREVCTEKISPEVLTVQTKPLRRGLYGQDRGRYFLRTDRANSVNKSFITVCLIQVMKSGSWSWLPHI